MTTLLKITAVIATEADPSTVLDLAQEAAARISEECEGTMDEEDIGNEVCVEPYAPAQEPLPAEAALVEAALAFGRGEMDMSKLGGAIAECANARSYRDAKKLPRAVGVNVEVSDERIADLITSAMEGGTGYWCTIIDYENPDKEEVEFKHIELPLTTRGAVILRLDLEPVEEAGDENRWRLDRAAVERGLKLMAAKHPRHWADFISENDDATTADVFLQCALLGEVVYG
jgi:hypothetical protein